MLTICYVTYRRQPCIEWFLESLSREVAANKMTKADIRLVIVDWHKDRHDYGHLDDSVMHVTPKPSVWQGPHRLTREDYFSASNARNTGLCYAPDGWIAYVDDLSVLMPGWLAAVRRAMEGGYIACGAYQKVKDLNVYDGKVESFTELPNGRDSRWYNGSDNDAVIASGSQLYGCSCVMPVEALLKVNGWPEDLCDGTGSEDYITGMVLEKHGYEFRYERRMFTLEGEESAFFDKPLKRCDYGEHPKNKSHEILHLAGELTRFEQSFGDIRDLRATILAGGSFPIPTMPTHEWFTGIPLGELP